MQPDDQTTAPVTDDATTAPVAEPAMDVPAADDAAETTEETPAPVEETPAA